MEISFFLAKVLGLYLAIIGLYMFIMPEHLRRVVDDILSNRGLFFLSAIIALILGILLVISHNEWIFNWRVLITLIGWISLLKGITNMFIPHLTTQFTERYFNSDFAYRIAGVISFSFGMILLYCGFFLT